MRIWIGRFASELWWRMGWQNYTLFIVLKKYILCFLETTPNSYACEKCIKYNKKQCLKKFSSLRSRIKGFCKTAVTKKTKNMSDSQIDVVIFRRRRLTNVSKLAVKYLRFLISSFLFPITFCIFIRIKECVNILNARKCAGNDVGKWNIAKRLNAERIVWKRIIASQNVKNKY